MHRYLAGAVAAAFLLVGRPASAQDKLTVFWGKGFYKSEDDALFEAIKKFEEKTEVKIELSQYAPQDMIPKTVAALDSGTPPDVAYARRLRLPGRRQMGLRGQARGHLRHHQADEGPVRAEHGRDHLPLQRQDQEEGLLRLPDEAADHAHPVLERHAGAGGLQGIRHPEGLEGLLGLLVRQGAAGYRQKTGKRIFAIGQPMGVDSSDSFYSFLTFMDAYNVKLVDDNGKLLVDDPKVQARG